MKPGSIDPVALLAFATAVYERCGMRPDDAALCADTLVQADLWGHQSHGVLRLSWYAARLRAGVCDPKAVPTFVVDAGAVGVMDGHEAMGQVLAARAAEDAVVRAKAHGLGAVAIRNSNHFGTAMYFTRIAAKEGCIGFLTTNASPSMAPWGGKKKALGNNPWSWAAPAGRHDAMVLDIANTAVARGKIYLARENHQEIPAGWALDAHGVPTTDPSAAIEGIIAPMAGHKGYAISVVMDMLAGVLSGSGFGDAIKGPYQFEQRSGAGQLMLVLNIAAFQPLAEFEARMETLVEQLKSVPRADGVEEIFYPGEIEARNDRENRRDGLLLPDDVVEGLDRLADEMRLPPLTR
jgi:LDH2 family malate/lactate/ureidoglycolate dehydrogenase